MSEEEKLIEEVKNKIEMLKQEIKNKELVLRDLIKQLEDMNENIE